MLVSRWPAAGLKVGWPERNSVASKHSDGSGTDSPVVLAKHMGSKNRTVAPRIAAAVGIGEGRHDYFVFQFMCPCGAQKHL